MKHRARPCSRSGSGKRQRDLTEEIHDEWSGLVLTKGCLRELYDDMPSFGVDYQRLEVQTITDKGWYLVDYRKFFNILLTGEILRAFDLWRLNIHDITQERTY